MVALYGITCIAAFLINVAYIGFFNKKDIWFLMTFISLLICNTGYLALALSRTLAEALLANRFAYLGSVFLPFFLLMTIIKICRVKIPKWLPFALSFLNAAVLLVTVSPGFCGVYYKSATFAIVHGAGKLIKEYGPLHLSYYAYLVAYFIAMLGVIIRAFFKRRIVSYKHAVCLSIAVMLNICIYFVEKAIDSDFEILSFSYIVAALFLLFIYKALEDYNIDGILQNTLVTDSTGVILFDTEGNFKGCNEDAAAIFPELSELKLEYPVPAEATELNSNVIPVLSGTHSRESATYRHGDRIFRITAKPFYRKGSTQGKALGTAIVISDDTTQQEYFALLSTYNDRLEEEVAQKTQRISNMHNNLILGMAEMVESRDPNTGGHIKRTSAVVSVFVQKLIETGYDNLSESFLNKVAKAAPMHDLGKVAIDDAVLRKPGKYMPEEYCIMQTHAEKGAEIVGKILHPEDDEEFYRIAVNVAHYHHEKYDGTGYPERRKGAEIPVEARIMALADVFDALVSKRCYKEEYSYAEAFAIIGDALGQQFDPALGAAFLACKSELESCYT